MISYTSLQFYMNAAFEVPAVLFLCGLLVSILLRKSSKATMRPFCLLVLDLIFLLLCNLSTWVLDGMLVSPSHFPGLYKLDLVLTVSDFFCYCLAGILFFDYLIAFAGKWGRKKRGRALLILISYTFLMTGLFATSIYTGWLYYFPEDGYTYYTAAYWVFVLFSIPGIWFSFLIIFKNRKEFGRRKSIVSLAYLVVPMLTAVFDQIFSLSVSYVILPLLAAAIYVGVDVEQDRVMLQMEAELSEQKAQKTEMKVNLMVSQIQPHFLYNTLGTIYQLCGKDVKLAQQTIKNFTKYLRINMESLEQSKLIPFEKELEHTKIYLSIEQLRFSDVLQVEYDIEYTDFELPALSLQPIVENAVKHGIRSREEGGTVTVSTRCENGKIYVSVYDDGMGFDTEHLPEDGRMHVGIANVRKRLEYMCGGKLEIESKIGVGTVAAIILEDKNESASA